MAKTNVTKRNANPQVTHEGAPALPLGSNERQLRRAVANCLLWEDGFYEDGVAIADRISQLVAKCKPQFVMGLAYEARHSMNLRHAPLWLLVGLMRKDAPAAAGLADTIADVVSRADEPGELISLYRKAYPNAGETKRPLPAALKRGLAKAMQKFDAYQLGKYKRGDKTEFSLRDILRLTHAKPKDAEQAALWKQAVEGTLKPADTWEVALSAGADKRATFERLLAEGKLGYLALLRNLRNMQDSGVSRPLVREAILARKGARRVLPFRYVAAARAAPQFEPDLDEALVASIQETPMFEGETIILVDISGSMQSKLSGKSDLTRMDAAATLASIFPGKTRVFTFNTAVQETPPRKGMAGVDAIRRRMGGGTLLGAAVSAMNRLPHDRLVVLTDEESHDVVPAPTAKHAYMINVAQARHEVGLGKWTRIAGFSENVIRWMRELEQGQDLA